jgi:hypothetical protein
MQHLSFRSATGQTYQVGVPEPLEGLKSAYLFSFHKAGSTLMDNMVRRYCNAYSIPTFSLFNAAFDSGISTNDVMEDTGLCFTKTGRIYTGFRHYPSFDLDLKDVPCVLLVRDPRDMLVSMYYSVAKSHVAPKKHQKFLNSRHEAKKISIDEFALRNAGDFNRNFKKYQQKLPLESLTTYRYEDIIYEKQKWLGDLVKKLCLPVDSDLIRITAKEFDIFPASERQEKHIRQVHPGNHKNKLKKKTIETLNERLSEFLKHYDYS